MLGSKDKRRRAPVGWSSGDLWWKEGGRPELKVVLHSRLPEPLNQGHYYYYCYYTHTHPAMNNASENKEDGSFPISVSKCLEAIGKC